MIDNSANIEQDISNLFKEWDGIFPNSITKLPNSGSSRIYFRLSNKQTSAIAVHNADQKENIAFIDFTKQFNKSKINVPEIFHEDIKKNIYLISDLGNITLLDWLLQVKSEGTFPNEAIEIYKKAITQLAKMQIVAGKNFDYTNCYPFKEFDKKAIIFDLKYFKDKFVSNINISYNTRILESEFEIFSDYLLSANSDYFMFRDFQARNIMLVKNEPYFIDYQGGRKGALQYDLASLLFQAKAQIPENIKLELLEYYIDTAKSLTPINKNEFIEYYYGFALIRVLQTLGAYGLRGIIEQKKHFLESIPFAINNLKYLINKTEILNQLPELKTIIKIIINSKINYNQ